MVISGGNLKPDTLKPKEVVSLLLDDDEIESKCMYLRKKSHLIKVLINEYKNLFLDRQKQEERRQLEETRAEGFKEKDRKRKIECKSTESSPKIKKTEETLLTIDDFIMSPRSEVKCLMKYKNLFFFSFIETVMIKILFFHCIMCYRVVVLPTKKLAVKRLLNMKIRLPNCLQVN